jgi:transposase
MIGKIDKQNSLFSSQYLFEKLIPEDSIYKNLHKYRMDFLKDEDFKDLYCDDTGRRSIPPSVLCGVLLLQAHDNVSDEEAVQRVIFDIRWKYALDLPSEYAGFVRTNLVNFRVRLLTGNKERVVFDGLNNLAIKLGLLKPEETQIIDSTNIIGRAAVQDTYELVRTAIKKLIVKIRKHGKKQFTDIVHKQGLERYLEQKSKADIDWQDAAERKKILKELVNDGRQLLDELSLMNAAEDEVISKAAGLLSDILEQDITSRTEEQEKGISPEIKQGVAKDRVISTNDTEMRHGRKSASKKFDGYKVHITENRDQEWITNVEVTAGNVHDAEPSLDMVKEQEKTLGAKPKQMLGDGAYGTADNRSDFAQEGVELVSKVTIHYDDRIHKEDFKINLEKGSVECIAGQVTERYVNSKDSKGREIKTFVFDKGKCAVCEYRDRCTKSKTGRMIGINYNEKYLQEAREKQKSEEFETEYRTRAIIERKLSQIMNFGLRQARYIGSEKTKMQALFTATVANVKRLAIIARPKEMLC